MKIKPGWLKYSRGTIFLHQVTFIIVVIRIFDSNVLKSAGKNIFVLSGHIFDPVCHEKVCPAAPQDIPSPTH